MGGRYHTDGSGGVDGSDPRLCRPGWAACQTRADSDGGIHLVWAEWGELPQDGHQRPSVPRAELYALHRVLLEIAAKAGAPQEYHIDVDAQYVVGGMARIVLVARGGASGALWAQVLRLRDKLCTEGQTVKIAKVTAHITDEQQQERQHARQQLAGNMIAGELAGRAAELTQVPHAGRRVWCSGAARRPRGSSSGSSQSPSTWPSISREASQAPQRGRGTRRRWPPLQCPLARSTRSRAWARGCGARGATPKPRRAAWRPC